MKVREHIEECETENEITYDLCLSIYYKTIGLVKRWPTRRRLALMLQNRLAKRNVSWTELHVLGLHREVALSIINSYKVMDVLEMQEFKSEMTIEKIGELSKEIKVTADKETYKIGRLERQISGLMKGMEILLQNSMGEAYDDSILAVKEPGLSRPQSAFLSVMSSKRELSDLDRGNQVLQNPASCNTNQSKNQKTKKKQKTKNRKKPKKARRHQARNNLMDT